MKNSPPPFLRENPTSSDPGDLAEIEIGPAGLGLRRPKRDADVYVKSFVQGVFGPRRCMAARLGAAARERPQGRATAQAADWGSSEVSRESQTRSSPKPAWE
jgi:hypothetical protein